MKKNYYAIKIGNGVQDIIVTNWKECKKYTHYYNSVYKGFSNRSQAINWLNSLSDNEIQKRLAFQLKMARKRSYENVKRIKKL